MKNYFSDSNVTAMAIDAGAIVDSPENLEAYYTLSHNELKSIMNLAVETAIGSADVLVEALREITYSHDGYARKKAEQALATCDKLSEVKHDTK